jgi:arylsulfatase A-like enzyme
MVTHFDWTIGCINEQLRSYGITDETILIVTSDHGPKPSEKDIPHDPTNGLRGKKGSLYEGGFRVPLIIRYPNEEYKEQISKPVSLIDIYPTICDIIGISKPDGLDGQSFHNLLQGEEIDSPREIISEDGDGRIAVQESGWKYIQPTEDEKGELYNINEDIKESEDLFNKRQDKVDYLTGIIDSIDTDLN